MNYTQANNTYFAAPKDNPKDKIEVEIGDSKQPDKFYPQLKIMRWDNEVNFSARLVHEEKNPIVLKDGEKIKWQGEKIEAHLYSLTEGEGGHEFEVILKEKPKTNKIEFTLQTKGLDFFYQPELTNEEKIRGNIRPENVVGSYAIYASENKVNYAGGKEYKCGKVGHIYRPKITDVQGKWVWGELNIDGEKGILSVIIPQYFLDNASYPIKHAAGLTFGYESEGQSHSSLPGSYIYWSFNGFTGGVGTGVSMSQFMHASDPNKSLQLALYTKSGTTYTLLENGFTQTITTQYNGGVLAWYTGNFTTAPTTDAINYKLCFNGNSNIGAAYDTGDSYYFVSQEFGTWPSSFVTSTQYNSAYKFSIYCTYTAAASGPAKLKTWNGLVTAKIKTINGLEIAKVKTINGLV
jgi:hypothetical protein